MKRFAYLLAWMPIACGSEVSLDDGVVSSDESAVVSVPAGFTVQPVVSGLSKPTAMAWPIASP